MVYVVSVLITTLAISIFSVIDSAAQWEKHVIDSDVNRDHGHTTAAADLNNDGRPDALIAYGGRNDPESTDAVYWYECPQNPEDSSSEWIQHRITPNLPGLLPRWAWAIATGDVDNDGDIDVVCDDFDDGKVLLSINPLNQGGDITDTWQTMSISSGGSRYGQRMELTDVDGDGYKDVVFLKWNINEVCILWNPNLAPDNLNVSWTKKSLGPHGGSDTYDVYTADMDNDGDLDIITASGESSSGGVYWFEHPDNNPRNGTWSRHTIAIADYCFGALQIEDVDNDGWKDVIVNEVHRHPGDIMWFKNPTGSGGSNWHKYVIGEQTYPSASCLLDVDGDGENEIYVPDASLGDDGSSYKWADGGVFYLKKGLDATQEWTKHIVGAPPERGRRTRSIDVDGDGDPDLVSTADHNCIDGYYQCTISLVWWENMEITNTESLGDFDEDNDVDGLDLHSFMVSYANADSDADINTDGMVDSQDVAGFARDLARLFHELRRPASQGDL